MMQISYSSDAPAHRAEANLQQLIERVSESDLRAWVREIAIPRHFTAQPESNRKVRDWIQGQFESWGYVVQNQGPWANLLAFPPVARRRFVLIGAHYDSVAGTPGADDNASAVAAMLGCAKALATVSPRPPVMFVGFNREEDDLLGSLDFVESLPQQNWQVSQTHILEMVGYASARANSQTVPPGLPLKLPSVANFLGILGNKDSGKMVDAALQQAHTYFPQFPVAALKVPPGLEWVFPVLLRSDHAPFWKAGLPALMWTDTSEYRNPHYHKASDTPATLDYAFLRKVTQLLVTCAME